MEELEIDKCQIIGEVKERNKFRRAIVAIQEIAKASSDRNHSSGEMKEISEICRDALKGGS